MKFTPYPTTPDCLNLDIRSIDFALELDLAMEYGPAMVRHQLANNYRWSAHNKKFSVLFIWDKKLAAWIIPSQKQVQPIFKALKECGANEMWISPDGRRILKDRVIFDTGAYFVKHTGISKFADPVTDQGNPK